MSHQGDRLIARCLHNGDELAVLASVILLRMLLRVLVTRRKVRLRQAVGDALDTGAEHSQQQHDNDEHPHAFSVAG